MFKTKTARNNYLGAVAILAAGTMGGCEYSLVMLTALMVLPVMRYNAGKLYQLYSNQHTVGGVS